MLAIITSVKWNVFSVTPLVTIDNKSRKVCVCVCVCVFCVVVYARARARVCTYIHTYTRIMDSRVRVFRDPMIIVTCSYQSKHNVS